jgi:hypothetical protein
MVADLAASSPPARRAMSRKRRAQSHAARTAASSRRTRSRGAIGFGLDAEGNSADRDSSVADR